MDQQRLVGIVPRGRTFRRARARGPAKVAQRPATVDYLHDLRSQMLPCPHVPRLFLQPDDFFEARITFEHRTQIVFGEGIDLLQSADRHCEMLRTIPAPRQFHADLAARQDQATYALRIASSLLVLNDGVEPSFGKLALR